MLQLRTGLLRFERLPCFGYPFVLASLLHLALRDLPKGWPAQEVREFVVLGEPGVPGSGTAPLGPGKEGV
jgi:hypothetical protein